jgi:carbonic anhydrase
MPHTLLKNNRDWVERKFLEDPEFFTRLSQQQTPRFLWIGCSDSRVPANQIIGLEPGEVFVHRNIANVVVHTDLNCLSVIQFAVDVLKVEHIIVCGHYGCSGVHAALNRTRIGLADNWLRHVQDVAEQHEPYLGSVAQELRHDRLCAGCLVSRAGSHRPWLGLWPERRIATGSGGELQCPGPGAGAAQGRSGANYALELMG